MDVPRPGPPAPGLHARAPRSRYAKPYGYRSYETRGMLKSVDLRDGNAQHPVGGRTASSHRRSDSETSDKVHNHCTIFTPNGTYG